MSKSQIWIAGFLVLFLLLFGISQVTKNEEHSKQTENYSSDSEPAGTEVNALTLIKNNGCTSCHGSDLRGSNLGPSLINIKQYWNSREDLISYLRNPSSFMDKERFKKHKEKYTSVVMPPFSHIDIKELGRIADYLRGL